jgi:hypothetical protein
MRKSFFVSLLALGLAACASSPSSSGSAAPAAAPAAGGGAAQAQAAVGANPCATGNCRITIEMDPATLAPLNEKALTFKAWKGCPRDLGVSGAGDTRTLKDPLADSRTPSLSLKPFDGTKVTLGIWFGPDPQRIVAVDFASGVNQTVKSPWMSGGAAGYQNDDVVVRQHGTTVTRCR